MENLCLCAIKNHLPSWKCDIWETLYISVNFCDTLVRCRYCYLSDFTGLERVAVPWTKSHIL